MQKRKCPIAEEVISLKCGRKLAYCEHGVRDGEPIIFFSGAGFGRRYIPTPFPYLLDKYSVRLITIDRPGYGRSDLQPGRNYRDWVADTTQLMHHLGLSKARFIAHSAGTPHLAAVCALAPKKVIAAAFVCPVAPIVGKVPLERPPETCARGCSRFCLLYFGGVLDSVFRNVFRKWQADPTTFVNDSMKQIVSKKDVAFMKEHPGFFKNQYASDFGDAVQPPHGAEAMLEDMFHTNNVPWTFGYSDAACVPVQVWWGGADDTAPHGKWICEQLGVEGTCVGDAGHGLIHSEFGPIVQALLRLDQF